jgi:hypothetical protein
MEGKLDKSRILLTEFNMKSHLEEDECFTKLAL